MKNLILISFLFIGLVSFAQDEIKYKTAFENVEQNCDSLKKVEFCYLVRFQSVINRKFTDELRKNNKLSKHIDDNIYLEIEIDTVGKFVINKIETKSSEIKKALLDLINNLPKVKSLSINKKKIEAILDFNLSEYNNDNSETEDTKSKKENQKQQIPMFTNSKVTNDEEKDKISFFNEMNNHIIKKFNYPKKAKDNNIIGRVLCHFIINKKGSVNNFIVYGADNL